jgi:hypothetical protein
LYFGPGAASSNRATSSGLMAVVRHFALNLVRQVADKRSINRRRKRAAWDTQYLLDTLGPLQPESR